MAALDWPALQFQTPSPDSAGVSLSGTTYSLHQRRGQDRTWVVELPQDTVNGTTSRSLGASRIDHDGVGSTNLTPGGSAWEYAYNVQPSGGTGVFVGTRAHGYETDDSIAVTVDGSTVTPGGTVQWGDEVVVTRLSTLTHPDAVGTIGTVVTTYTMSKDGLDVVHTTTWLAALTGGQCYGAMMPFLEVLDTGKTFGGTKATLTSNDDSVNSSSQSKTAWAWDANGDHGMCMALLDTDAVGGWSYSDGNDLWLQDRTGGSFNKVYAGFTGRDITSGDVWTSRVRYLADFFDGGAAATLDR